MYFVLYIFLNFANDKDVIGLFYYILSKARKNLSVTRAGKALGCSEEHKPPKLVYEGRDVL